MWWLMVTGADWGGRGGLMEGDMGLGLVGDVSLSSWPGDARYLLVELDGIG
jgi:hypothetical protein